MINQFTPGNSIVATVATSSAAITLPGSGNQVMVSSLAANAIAYVAFSATTPTVVIPTGTAANGVPILPGQQRIFTIPTGTALVATIGTAGNTLVFTRGDGGN